MSDSSATQPPPIVLYHYPASPYAKRLVWYMQLRGIPYVQCIQPMVMPRPDLTRLGIKYRRIPLLSIGRDVYLDTRLILQKLEAIYPNLPILGAAPGTEQKALERLLEAKVIDGGIFTSAALLLPTDLPAVRDPAFQKDRADYRNGVRMTKELAAALRPEALAEIKAVAALLETTLLADGRDWLLKTSQPSLADIEAVWPLHWLSILPGALPADQVSAKQFPLVFAWIARFQATVSAAAKSRGEKPKVVTGEEAHATITQSAFHEAGGGGVDASEPIVQSHGLRKGQVVELWPTDSGSSHKDVGKLVSLGSGEVVIETGAGVRLHAPRHGFRFHAAGAGGANL
ncbi:hypothetical protein B0T17DRAFT_612444 [Bombardia bombarda]|uniref:GST C-terminal domain-containing protein n=1 Tax=Bombardia bombarda TaxID=252184 RepID=A0AA40CEK3_9PEZI|nr:hypothetical protein B0T17DRAFT_612444 [Bombardia bombarda]